MAINATVDGVTYSGIDTINTGGKSILLEAVGGFNADAIALKNISQAIGESATVILNNAFGWYNNLEYAEFPNVLSIYQSAFERCGVRSVSFPLLKSISDYGFYSCLLLSSAYIPNVEYIGARCFQMCRLLSEISAPNLSSTRYQAFANAGLIRADFPSLTSLGTSAFEACTSLTFVSLPLLTSLPATTFIGCNRLSEVYLPNVGTFGTGAEFRFCSALSTVSFPKLSAIPGAAFMDCVKLLSLYLMGESVVTLGASGAFTHTPIAGSTASTAGQLGSIYVPASLLTEYQSATNWAFFSERFVGV